MEPVNPNVHYFSLLLLVAFVLKNNEDEKTCEISASESLKTRITGDRMLI